MPKYIFILFLQILKYFYSLFHTIFKIYFHSNELKLISMILITGLVITIESVDSHKFKQVSMLNSVDKMSYLLFQIHK